MNEDFHKGRCEQRCFTKSYKPLVISQAFVLISACNTHAVGHKVKRIYG